MNATLTLIRQRAAASTFAAAQGSFASSIQDPALTEIGFGEYRAGDAASIFALRGDDAAAAGTETRGVPETVESLRKLPAETRVRLFHLKRVDALTTIFVDPAGMVVGWLTVFARPPAAHGNATR